MLDLFGRCISLTGQKVQEFWLKERTAESKMEKSYEKVIEYVKHGIGSGEIQAGEKLLPERELAQKLEISRNSAREGLMLLYMSLIHI